MTKKLLFLYLLLIGCYSISYGQEHVPTSSQREYKKNALLATVGTVGLMGAYNLSYERMLLVSKEGAIQGLWAKAGVGGWGVWSTGGPYQSLMLGTMTGEKNSHFELNFGIARMVNRSGYDRAKSISEHLAEPEPQKADYIDFRPTGSLGYRYQKPTSRFLFRTGIGYPETLYLGIGAAF